jgi:hypothetical protein
MPKETCVEPVHQLPSNYRIMVNGNGKYKVQRKESVKHRRWFKDEEIIYWSDVKFVKEYSAWGLIYRGPFDTKSEACEAMMQRLEAEATAKREGQWKDAGPC